MRIRSVALAVCLLLGCIAETARPQAAGGPQAVLHGGMPGTVRDATRVGSVIYGVGTFTNATGRIDGALWTWDGTNPPTRTALPDNCTVTCGTQNVQAGEAITPDAAYIASQARTGTGATAVTAVRVTRSTLANFNLTPTATTNPKLARAISDDGSILYGNLNVQLPGGVVRTRAVQYDVVHATTTAIFDQPATDAAGFDISQGLLQRGASSDGSVVVGQTFTNQPAVDSQAFRYVKNVGTSLIARLPGGTFNVPMALSNTGNYTLVRGDSTEYPNSEMYVHDAAASAIVRLGTPNVGLSITGTGGITDDGAVVVVSGSSACTTPCSPDVYSYFHNSHGWFNLASALGSAGVDLSAWRDLQAFGMSGDGTLVWGGGGHNGVREGFVAEFAPGYLAGFNPPFVAPLDTSIIGVWSEDEVGAESHFIVFTAGGAYFQIEDGTAGFERGSYTFDGQTLALVTRFDSNGSSGLSDMNGISTPLSVVGDTLGPMHRIVGSRGSVTGGWLLGDPSEPDNSMLVVLSSSTYGTAFDSDDHPSETGTYTWSAATYELDVFPTGGTPNLGNHATPSADGRTLLLVDEDGEEFTLSRIIDPATIPVIAGTPLSASGVVGTPFDYAVSATNTVTSEATGLPGGLTMDSATGHILGTPTVGGQFAVTILAANSAGVADIKPLTLTIAMPTSVGVNVTVEPQVPQGQGPITVSFGEVTAAGTTTVAVLDQSNVPPPGNVSVAGVMYEVTTTAHYQGLINLCFSYAGIDFGSATPRLFHYENNVWVDVTTSVDPATQTVCGATTSLSPFAVLVSNVVRTGFYSPVNPIAGFLNVINGGRTVPLKFNVVVNGVEKKTTDGLDLTVQRIACDTSAPLDPVEPAAVSGGSALRYDATAHAFIQNWKSPGEPGCYMVRMTTLQDGLSLTARFKVK